LFSLNFWHLAERMFFAGITKEQRADASRDDYLTKEKSHDALAE